VDAPPPPGQRTLRSLWELGDELFAVLDADGCPQVANAAWTRDLGWNAQLLVDRPLSDLVHPDDRQALADGLDSLDGSRNVANLEVRLQAADGRYHDLLLRLQRSPTAGVCLVAHDVTGERTAQRDLDDSERRFRLAMEHAPIGMALADLRGSWIRVNDALCRLLGRRRDELIGHVVDQVTHPDHIDRSHAEMGTLLAGERDHFTFDKQYLHGDGHVVDAAVTASLVRDDDGEPLYVIGQIVDITERNRTEARLRTTVRELERANEALENFATIASHDLKSPMAIVQGLLQTLVSRSPDGLEAADHDLLHRALTHASTLTGAIDGLLEMSRTRTQPLQFEPVDLNDTLAEVEELLRDDIDREAATIDAGQLPTVHGDPVLLRLLLQNLVANAIKFRHDDRAPDVTVEVDRDATSWEVAVTDNGRGFDEQDEEAIFELFGRTGDGERIEGAGIGLATCRQIAQRHGGSIRAIARDGGARFVVSLPLGPSDPTTTSSDPTTTSSDPTTASSDPTTTSSDPTTTSSDPTTTSSDPTTDG
jgi:PAS domain S-box-containing protein